MTDWFGVHTWPLPRGVNDADFAYWSRARGWYLEEAVSLALGADPESANNYVSSGLYSVSFSKNEKPSFEAAYQMLLELAKRQFVKEAMGIRIDNATFLDWLIDARLPYPEGLRSAMAEYGRPFQDWQKIALSERAEIDELKAQNAKLETTILDKAISGSFGTKEKESLQKLIIGMAVKGYRYDPKSGRSPIPKEISDDLALLGLALSDDTVRKHLKDAAELLPQQNKT